jgi:uncharacterized SAM-binding protein YcdF (DUF218 family)
MFFIVSKIIHPLLNPFFWIVILFTLGVFLRKGKWKKRCLISSFSLLLLFSNNFIFNQVSSLWTVPITPSQNFKKAKIGIVLGGMLIYDPRNEKPHFFGNIDRLLQALPQLENGQMDKLLISGGSGYRQYQNFSEAVVLNDYLNSIGFNTEDILLEKTSKNTYENAKFSVELLKEKYNLNELQNNVVLFTSSGHMRRSLACFEKQGLKCIPYSTNPVNQEDKPIFWEDIFIPQPRVLIFWSNLSHEILGYLVYKTKGYL